MAGRSYCFRLGMGALAAAAVMCMSSATFAQTQLQWKFKTGDKFDLQLAQDMKIAVSAAGQTFNQNVVMGMDISWKVESVEESTGMATVSQEFKRIRMNANGPQGNLSIDTQQPKPEGETAAVWEQLHALVGAKITQKMDQRGNIADVELDEQAKEALAKNAQFQQLFSGDGMKQMFGQSLSVLPEKPVVKGESWKSSSETKTPFGAFKLNADYVFDGMADHNGKQMAKLSIKGVMNIEGDAANEGPKISIKDSKIEGTAWFDIEAGHLAENAVVQKMDMSVEAGGQNIGSNINTNIKLIITPAK